MQNIVMNFIKKKDYFDETNQTKNKSEENDLLKLDNLVNFENEYEFDKMKKLNLSATSTKWFAYPKSLALINETVSFVDETDSLWKRCKFWQDKGLDKYAWTC